MATNNKGYPFDLIDLIFILVAPNHHGLILLAIVQYFLRHNAGLWQAVVEVANEVNYPIVDPEYGAHPFTVAVIPAFETVVPPAPRQQKRLPPPQKVEALPKPPEKQEDAKEDTTRQVATKPVAPIIKQPEQDNAAHLATIYNSIFTSDNPPPLSQAEELFNRLHLASHLAVVGETKAGKSTLLNYLAATYIARGEFVLVLDPHSSPDKWPSGATVRGAARNYDEIADALGKLVRHMQARYHDIAVGKVRECEHPRIHVIADEWRAIKGNIRNAGELLGQLITEARKTNIRIILGAHSHYLTGLGVDDSATRESLTLAFLRMDKHGARSILVDKDIYPMPDLAGYSYKPTIEGPLIQQALPHIQTEAEEKTLAYIRKRGEWTTVREIVQNVRGMETAEARITLESLCDDGSLQKREMGRAERYGLPGWTPPVDVDTRKSVDVGNFSLKSTPSTA